MVSLMSLTPLTGANGGIPRRSIQDLQAGKLRRPNALKHCTTNPSTFQVLSYPVRYPRVLRYSELHLLSFRALLVSGSLDDLRITLPGFGLQDTDQDMYPQFLLQFCRERKGQSSQDYFSRQLIHQGTLSQVGTKRCPVLCYVPCRRVRKLSAFSFRKHGC